MEHPAKLHDAISLDMNIVVTVASDCNVRIWNRSRNKASAKDNANVFKFRTISQ